MLIEKKLNYTEKKYGYLFWSAKYDTQIKEILKNTTTIDVKINDIIHFSRNVDFNRRRIYFGSSVIKNLNCDTVIINITAKSIEIKCK